MLHKLKRFIGSHIIATDGKIGRIRTFLFDDRSWMIRYIVVEVSYWSQRSVVLPVSAVEWPSVATSNHSDWATRSLRVNVNMTRRQILESPDIETKKPVFLQQRFAMEERFGLLASWIDQDLLMPSQPTGMEYPVQEDEDPHLRSTRDMRGYVVGGADGKMGSLRGFVLDESSWHIVFLDVKRKNWLRRRGILIPSRQVERVSWGDRRILVRPSSKMRRSSKIQYKSASRHPAEEHLAMPAPEQLASCSDTPI